MAAAATATCGRTSPLKYICPFPGCVAEFPKPWRLELHQVTHTGEKRFPCVHPNCTKKYARADHLKRHVANSHTEILKTFQCPHCSTSVKSEDTLRKHIERIHEKERHKCSYCGKSFTKGQGLKIHEYDHTGILPFLCSEENCGKSFLLPSKLRQHEKVHRGYECPADNCIEKFETWTLLLKHKKDAHKPTFECKICGRTWQSKKNFKSHEATHSSIRKCFHCPFEDCERFYYYKSNLNQHIRYYHEGKKVKCPTPGCGMEFFNNAKLNHHLSLNSCNEEKIEKKVPKRRKKSLATKLSGYNPEEEKTLRVINPEQEKSDIRERSFERSLA